jgi:hypothetical protein
VREGRTPPGKQAGSLVWFRGWLHVIVYVEGMLCRIRRWPRREATSRAVYLHQVVTDADHRAMRNAHKHARRQKRRKRKS